MFFFVPVATSPTVICGVFVLLVWILSGRFLKDLLSWWKSDLALPVAGLIVLPWIGLIYTPLPGDGLPIAFKTHHWLYAIALAPILTTRPRPDLIIRAYLAGLSFNSAISILQFAGIAPLKKGLTTGLLGGSSAYIAYSLLLAAGLVIASFFFSKAQTRRERLIYAALMAQYFFTIGFNEGRSGHIALIVLSPYVVYNILGQRHVGRIFVISTVAVALLFSFPVVRSRFAKAKEDLELYKQGDVNTAMGQRLHMWKIALSEIKRTPLLGVGTAGFRKSWELHKKDPSLPVIDHPHNSFLYMTVSFGIAGMIVFCWLLFVILRRGWQGRGSPLGFSVLAFTTVFIIGSFSDTQVLPFATAVALPLFAGASEGIDVS